MKFDKDVSRVEMPDGKPGPPTNEAKRQMEIWLMLKKLIDRERTQKEVNQLLESRAVWKKGDFLDALEKGPHGC
ncbi:hypothetical protein LCGC14_2046200 [marine sediment metagenome]|uniref:Uncharacterized protein n=1 Tax=marine sediment metagenome TaxID=412755 RepID=A0A0F9EQD1_9ZZZZ